MYTIYKYSDPLPLKMYVQMQDQKLFDHLSQNVGFVYLWKRHFWIAPRRDG